MARGCCGGLRQLITPFLGVVEGERLTRELSAAAGDVDRNGGVRIYVHGRSLAGGARAGKEDYGRPIAMPHHTMALARSARVWMGRQLFMPRVRPVVSWPATYHGLLGLARFWVFTQCGAVHKRTELAVSRYLTALLQPALH